VADGPDPDAASAPRRRRGLVRVLRVVVTLVVVVAVFVGVLPQLADLSGAASAVRALPIEAVLGLTVLTVGVLATTWWALSRLIVGANVGQAGLAHLLSTAVANTVPAGGAVAVGVNLQVHASYGRTIATTTAGLLAMGVLDNAVKLGLPIALVAVSPFVPGTDQLPPSVPLVAAGFGVLAVAGVVAVLRGPVVARLAAWAQRQAVRVGRAGDTDWAAAATSYVAQLRDLLRDRGTGAFVAVAASHVLQVALLVVALRALGVPPEHSGIVRVTVVYALVRFLTAVPVTPGGVGIAELGLVAGLRAGVPGGYDGAIVAAVLLFRVATYVLPILLAAPAFVGWRLTRPRTPPAAA
jgi:putative heme transporter